MSAGRDLEQAASLLSFDEQPDPRGLHTKRKLKFLWPLIQSAKANILQPAIRILKRPRYPLFCYHSHSHGTDSSSQPPNNTVDHLTGLRGIAAMIVFIYHLAHGPYRSAMDQVYGSAPSSANNHLLQLPLLRVIYAAEASVALFFVLSGYTLARRPVAAIAAGNAAKASVTLGSLAFRRGMRLFMPAIASSFLALCALRVGWMPSRALPSDYVPGLGNDFRTYLSFLRGILDVWTWEINIDKGMWWFDAHLWTVPVEFRCSMVLFLLTFATQRCKPSIRILIDMACILGTLVFWRWDVALFVTGKVIAEFQSLRVEIFHYHHRLPAIRRVFALIICAVGLYLASYPAVPPSDSFFYMYLAAVVHQDLEGRRLYYAVAGVLILCSIELDPLYRSPFETQLLRYFGRISFSLYLTHGTLIRVIGGRILNLFWRTIGLEGWRFHAAFIVGSLIFLLLAVVVADVFYRLVESPCIQFSKLIESAGRAD